MVSAFQGNKAETRPCSRRSRRSWPPDVTVVADASMISDVNQKAIEAAGLSFTLGMKIPDVPHIVAELRKEHRLTCALNWPKSGPTKDPGGGSNAGPSTPVTSYLYAHTGRPVGHGMAIIGKRRCFCSKCGLVAVFGLQALRLWGSRPSLPLSAPQALQADLVALCRPVFLTTLARHQEPLPLGCSRHLVRLPTSLPIIRGLSKERSTLLLQLVVELSPCPPEHSSSTVT